MGKRNNKRTQKVNPMMNASVESPPYETASAMSNTEEVKKSKQDKNIDLRSCMCKNKITKKNRKPSRTWESITNLYGDADTTEVWDNRKEKRKKKLRSTLQKQENPEANIDKSDNNDVTMYPKYLLSDEPKNGLIDHFAGDICTDGPCREALENLYKLYGVKYVINKNDKVSKSDYKDKSKKENDKILIAKSNKIIKKSKHKQSQAVSSKKDRNVEYGDQYSSIPFNNQDSKDVQCKCSLIGKMMGRTKCKCKNGDGKTLQTSINVDDDDNSKIKKYTKHIKTLKKSNNKQPIAIKNKIYGNVGFGDQISPIASKKTDLKDIQGFIGKMVKRHTCKCENNLKNPTANHLFEMKVNLSDMRVMNSSEVNEMVRKLGRTGRDMSCICPSHMKRSICKGGPCESALENPKTRFNCRCPKGNIIECNDSTCDKKVRDIKIKSRPKREDDKPLFDVMLEPTEMNVINAREIKEIIGKAYNNKTICPNGICSKLSKQKNVQINCKCVGKKMSPSVTDCDERTCRNPEKKFKLSYLCSRVFSKSENWTGQDEKKKRLPVRANRHSRQWTNIKKQDIILRSHYKRNGVMIKMPHGQTPQKGTNVGGKLSAVWCKCSKKKTKKEVPIRSRNVKKVRRRRRGFFRKKKKDHRTLKEKILDCCEREQEECEKKVKKKTKEYEKNEKKAIKKNKKIAAEQKEEYETRYQDWNCLTNFITGFLNVSFESFKTVFKVFFSVLTDPISSYVYVKEKTKNPPAAIARVIQWFIRTWKTKSSFIAKKIDESVTLKVIADQIENSAVYDALVPKGNTPAEKMAYERRRRVRKRRIQKREDEALYGCRHMILTTLRKKPCLWFYHICPNMYPQCLSLTATMTNCAHVLLYCGAIMCWTPCIVACEMCRAFMCCFLCTH